VVVVVAVAVIVHVISNLRTQNNDVNKTTFLRPRPKPPEVNKVT